MNPRKTAILAGAVSTLVLGLALAQIVPETPRPEPPLRTAVRDVPVRDVTPRAEAPAAPPPLAGPAATGTATTTAAPVDPPAAQTPPVQAPAAPARRPAARAPSSVEVLPDNEDLRERVGAMREKLILAARSGDIARLGIVFQTNETSPVFSRGGERDPVAFWKQSSGDGEGREILAILLNVLDLPAALINKGTPQEMYVWPYLAHVPLDSLNERQTVDLYRLMTAQDVRDMRTIGSWVFWRVGIGPDGTLHYFMAGE